MAISTVDLTGLQPSLITSGAVQASTSGTAITFTGIPSWAKRVTVMFNGVSTSGTSSVQVRLGSSSGGVEATGYATTSWVFYATSAAVTTGFDLDGGSGAAATNLRSGSLVFTNLSGNSWTGIGNIGRDSGYSVVTQGAKTISSVLDRIVITTVNGTDTFDAGSINILYE